MVVVVVGLATPQYPQNLVPSWLLCPHLWFRHHHICASGVWCAWVGPGPREGVLVGVGWRLVAPAGVERRPCNWLDIGLVREGLVGGWGAGTEGVVREEREAGTEGGS